MTEDETRGGEGDKLVVYLKESCHQIDGLGTLEFLPQMQIASASFK